MNFEKIERRFSSWEEQSKAQDMIEQAVAGIIAQGGPAYTTKCVYRGTDNNGKMLKCLVGQLIPDEKYQGDMEGNALNPEYAGDAQKQILDAIGVTPESKLHHFLYECQQVHDNLAITDGLRDSKQAWLVAFIAQIMMILELWDLHSYGLRTMLTSAAREPALA